MAGRGGPGLGWAGRAAGRVVIPEVGCRSNDIVAGRVWAQISSLIIYWLPVTQILDYFVPEINIIWDSQRYWGLCV